MEELKRELSKIENKLLSITTDYSRKIVNCPCDYMNLLRQSLMYRNGAIGFQLDLIQNYQENLSNLIDQKDGFEIAQRLLLSPSRKLNYLFDDLVFNIMSFYDYFAAFVTYIFYGEEIRGTAKGYNPLSIENKKFDHLTKILWKISWTEFARLVKPNVNSKLKYDSTLIQSSTIPDKIIQYDNNFIINISKLRNDIIHNKASLVGQSLSFNPVDGTQFSFFAPGKFQELFPSLGDDYQEAVEYIINNFSKCIIEFCDALLIDIEGNRKVEKGKEWIKFKSELGPET